MGETPPQVRRTCNRAGFQQRLELPVLRPPLVVAHVGFDGAHQRPVLTFGAQVRVHLPQGRLRGWGHDCFREGVHQFRADLRALLLGERLHPLGQLAGGCGGDHVHHVHVRNIIQFTCPALAHANNRQIQGIHGCATRGGGAQPPASAFSDFGAGDSERPLQGGCGQVSKVPPNGRHKLHRVG